MLRVGSIGLIIALASPPALAGLKDAKKHFRKGQKEYKLGRFQEALDAYSKAYEAKELPAFLFNIGQCHIELGNYERAIFFFEGYLRAKPNAGNLDLVESRIALAKEQERLRQEEEARVAAEQERQEREERERAVTAAQLARDAEQERLVLEQKRLERERAEADMRAAEALKQVKLAEVEARGPALYETWWFWTAVGVVVVGGVVIALTTGGETQRVAPSGDLETIDGRTP